MDIHIVKYYENKISPNFYLWADRPDIINCLIKTTSCATQVY